MVGTTLYLGLDPKNFVTRNQLIHYPVIQTVPRDYTNDGIRAVFDDIPDYTHLLFTSQVGVQTFFSCLAYYGFSSEDLIDKKIFSVGQATAAILRKQGLFLSGIARKKIDHLFGCFGT